MSVYFYVYAGFMMTFETNNINVNVMTYGCETCEFSYSSDKKFCSECGSPLAEYVSNTECESIYDILDYELDNQKIDDDFYDMFGSMMVPENSVIIGYGDFSSYHANMKPVGIDVNCSAQAGRIFDLDLNLNEDKARLYFARFIEFFDRHNIPYKLKYGIIPYAC